MRNTLASSFCIDGTTVKFKLILARSSVLTVVLILTACLDVPLSWLKVKGGGTFRWGGYELLLAEWRAGNSL